jgi:predicted RNase H-like nuclease (RuvC/YqgF family)
MSTFLDWAWSKGAPAGLSVCVLLALHYAYQALRARRADRREDQQVIVADSATVQATQSKMIDQLQVREVAHLGRIDALEDEVDDLRARLYRQQDEYEQKLAELRGQVADLMERIDGLQRSLRQSAEVGDH